MQITSGIPWTDKNSTPMLDIRRTREFCNKAYGMDLTSIYIGSAVMDSILASNEMDRYMVANKGTPEELIEKFTGCKVVKPQFPIPADKISFHP